MKLNKKSTSNAEKGKKTSWRELGHVVQFELKIPPATRSIGLMKNNCLHDIVFIKISKLMKRFFSDQMYCFQHKNALCFSTIAKMHIPFKFRLIQPFFSVAEYVAQFITSEVEESEKNVQKSEQKTEVRMKTLIEERMLKVCKMCDL